MSYADVNRGELSVQIAHAPADAADLIVKLEVQRDRYRDALENIAGQVPCITGHEARSRASRALNQEGRDS